MRLFSKKAGWRTRIIKRGRQGNKELVEDGGVGSWERHQRGPPSS